MKRKRNLLRVLGDAIEGYVNDFYPSDAFKLEGGVNKYVGGAKFLGSPSIKPAEI